MTRHRSLRMDEHFDRFIEERIESDGYGSAEAVVQAGLRLLEEQEGDARKLEEVFLRESTPWTPETLAAALQAGLDSGEPRGVDLDALLEDVLAEHRRQP